MPESRLFLIIAAAGAGTRIGTPVAKQYVQVHGRALIAHSLLHLRMLDPARTIVAIAADDRLWSSAYAEGMSVDVQRCGGTTRAETVRNAVDLLAGDCVDGDYVLVHDAARALVPADALNRLVSELADDDTGGLLALPVADTLKREDGTTPARSTGTEDRRGLWQAQTPQMFRYGKLRAALHMPINLECTDEAQAMERAGHRPRLVRGSAFNLKVTMADDLVIAAAILAAQNE